MAFIDSGIVLGMTILAATASAAMSGALVISSYVSKAIQCKPSESVEKLGEDLSAAVESRMNVDDTFKAVLSTYAQGVLRIYSIDPDIRYVILEDPAVSIFTGNYGYFVHITVVGESGRSNIRIVLEPKLGRRSVRDLNFLSSIVATAEAGLVINNNIEH